MRKSCPLNSRDQARTSDWMQGSRDPRIIAMYGRDMSVGNTIFQQNTMLVHTCREKLTSKIKISKTRKRCSSQVLSFKAARSFGQQAGKRVRGPLYGHQDKKNCKSNNSSPAIPKTRGRFECNLAQNFLVKHAVQMPVLHSTKTGSPVVGHALGR